MHPTLPRTVARRVARASRGALLVCCATVFAYCLTTPAAASVRLPAALAAETGTVVETSTDMPNAPPPLWRSPVSGLNVTGPFRAPPHKYGSGHRGIDLFARPGDEVIAPAAGTVSFVGRVVDRPLVSVRVDDRTVYSIEPVRSDLTQGDRVAAGASLGSVAEGGHCSGECVHLGVRVNDEYVNPLRYLLYRPVLLPWQDG